MIKRKRNKKLENDISYNVILDTEVDCKLLEPYTFLNLSTGMEEEEEKEHHLKNIIAQGSGEIPTPVVTFVKNYDLFGEYQRPRDFIRWEGDAPNRIILEEQDIQFMKENSISEEHLLRMCNSNYRAEQIDSKIKEYLDKRVLRIISDEKHSDAYICFRKRIIKSIRKSRRSEANVSERLKRIWVELNLLKKLYSLHLRRCELEKEHLSCYSEIVKVAINSEIDSKLRRKIKKKIFKQIKISGKLEYYKSCGTFDKLIRNYNKIKILKDFLNKFNPSISPTDLEKEVKAFENYRNRKTDSA